MIEVNKFIQNLKPSSTLAINQKVKKLREERETVYHFGFGQSPFRIHNSITNELTKHVSNNNYLPTLGLDSLRVEISKFLENHQGIRFKSENVLVGPGSKELLYQTILILEGIFLIPKGSWVSYLPQIKSKNGDYQILETFFENDFKLTANILDEYCQEKPNVQKTLIINSPNNPTGSVYTENELKSLAEVCRRHHVIVLSDEIYSQINFDASYSPSLATYYPEKTIVFGGLSKVFSAGGYRLGFLALPEELKELINTYRSLFSETFSAVSSPIQYAAIKAYKYEPELQKYVRDCSNILKLISNYVYESLVTVDLQCTKPQGAFYLMIGFSKFKEKFSKLGITNSNQLADFLLSNYNVALLPSTDFYFEKEELFFRLAFVDFDGEKVLRAYKSSNAEPKEFIREHCPSIYLGSQQLIKCINDLK